MKDKVRALVVSSKNFAAKAAPAMSALTLMGLQTANAFVYATGSAGDAGALAETLISIVGKLIVALGVFIGAMGIVNFASAHSEGNGGAQDKATKQIAAGVMVVALSALLIGYAPDLANYITTSTG